jgi:hypothetical protein
VSADEIKRLFQYTHIMEDPHSVYILTRKNKAVYIGCSKTVKSRVVQHRKDKDFDSYTILKTYRTKQEALNAENAIIRFLTLFGDGDWYNAEDVCLSYYRDRKRESF